VNRTILRKAAVGALVALAVGAGAASAATVADKYGAKLDFTFEAGAGTFAVKNANFGSGQFFDTDETDSDVDWQEYYMLPKLSGTYGLGASTLYSEFAMAATGTRGDGDAIAYTEGNTDNFNAEIVSVGWKSGKLFESLGENAIDAYYGKARLVISDAFLVGDGSSDRGRQGAFWLAPHSSFQRVGALRVNTSPVRGDLFFLETDETQYVTHAYGANLEGTIGKYGTLGGMFLRLTGSELDSRDGMRVYELRYMGNPLADLIDNSYLNIEYAKENNPDSDVEVNATAYTVEAGHTFELPWSPALSYRFARYSGDKDPDDGQSEAFDALFQKGFSRGWGTWLEGEIMGEYFYSNSNKQSHTVAIKAKPVEEISTGILLYRIFADEKNLWGDRLTHYHLADEADLYVDYTVNENLLISAAAGYAKPGRGLRDLGYDQDTAVFEIAAYVYF
jgi:hypothetical protein